MVEPSLRVSPLTGVIRERRVTHHRWRDGRVRERIPVRTRTDVPTRVRVLRSVVPVIAIRDVLGTSPAHVVVAGPTVCVRVIEPLPQRHARVGHRKLADHLALIGFEGLDASGAHIGTLLVLRVSHRATGPALPVFGGTPQLHSLQGAVLDALRVPSRSTLRVVSHENRWPSGMPSASVATAACARSASWRRLPW